MYTCMYVQVPLVLCLFILHVFKFTQWSVFDLGLPKLSNPKVCTLTHGTLYIVHVYDV